MKYLEDYIGEIASLEIHECECGFHMGIDSSYLEQVGSVHLKCPSCNRPMDFEGYDDEEETEKQQRSLTVADLIVKLERVGDKSKYVFWNEPYDDGDEVGINEVEEFADGVHLT